MTRQINYRLMNRAGLAASITADKRIDGGVRVSARNITVPIFIHTHRVCVCVFALVPSSAPITFSHVTHTLT
jgi:hypothetical protein